MRKTFILIILLYSSIAFAAKEHLIELEGDSLLFKNFRINITEVIDKRESRDNIGYTMKGLFDVLKPVRLKGGIESALSCYMNKMFISDSSFKPIKIHIKELLITEEDFTIEQKGACHLVMEFIDSTGKLLYMTDYKSSFSAFEASGKYEGLLKHLIKKSILAFSLFDSKYHPYIDLLNQQDNYYPILQCSNPQKGFYANFREFQANNPSLQFAFEVEEVAGRGRKYYKIKLKDTSIDSNVLFDLIYGFSDGKTVFIKQYNSDRYFSFVPIHTLGRFSYVGKKVNSTGIPIILPFMVGVASVPYKQEYIIDISTGKEHPLNDEILKKILVSDTELYKQYINQSYERRNEMSLYWLEQYNKRYLKNR
jgi:hypothetical protein